MKRERVLIIFWTIALTALFYITGHAKADDYSIRGGPSIKGGKPDGSAKYFGVRDELQQDDGVWAAVEGGGWVDSSPGRKASLIAKFQLGVKPGQKEGIYGKAFLGPCFITTTDGALGGHGQICTDIGFGVRDRQTFMGFGYSHTSSAGLSAPNKGRDFLFLEAGVHF